MIKHFEELKKQLGELAGVLNAFKSEAVQLKIVEFVFKAEGVDDSVEDAGTANPEDKPNTRRSRHRSLKAPASTGAKEGNTPKKKGGSLGPAQLLSTLISDGFFKSKQSIGHIIAHAKAKKAATFKPNELSGTLARFVRDGRLHRETNKDGQYEYYVK